MNTKIYKRVLSLTNELLAAAQEENQTTFDSHYSELKQLCEDNEASDKDHPVQWETLADFTDDLTLAVTIYEQALVKAEAINSKDFRSSISYSIATLKVELGDETGAIEHLEKAKISCNKIADKELKAEIHDLLEKLTGVTADSNVEAKLETESETKLETTSEPQSEAKAKVKANTTSKATPYVNSDIYPDL